MSGFWPWAPATLLVFTLGCANPVQELWPPAKDAPTRTIIVSVDTWHAMIAFPQGRTEGRGPRTELESSDTPSHASSPRHARDLQPVERRLPPSRRLGRPTESPAEGLAANPSIDSGPRAASNGSAERLRPQKVEALAEAGTPHPSSYEEWGFAEQAWYLEGQMGITGVIRALFWPSQGVVEVGHYNRVWSDRTPQPPAERFTFQLSEQGYHRLRQHLQATRASTQPVLTTDGSTFFPAARSYHVFHQCHHYSARALRAAGLPVSPSWALTRGLFAAQLRRAGRIAAEKRTDADVESQQS